MPESRSSVVVIGATTTALRLSTELLQAGETVTVVVGPGAEPWIETELRTSGATVIEVEAVRSAELDRCGVSDAATVVVLGHEDVSTMRIALAVEERAPRARLVLEMSNPELGNTLHALLGECDVLSSAELAGPSFVAAALATDQTHSFDIAGRAVVTGPEPQVGGEILARLGDARGADAESLLHGGDVVLGTEVASTVPASARTSGWWGAFVHVFDSRLRFVVMILLALMVVSTVYFHSVADVDWLTAIYYALTASTLTGLGDIEGLSLPARFGGVAIQLIGVILSSGVTAVIVDALLSARLGELTSGVRGRPRHHIIVCGLGKIGATVVARLHEQGVAVVALDRDASAPGVAAARRLKVPVVIADATDRAALEHAGVTRARSLLAITDNDAVNLEVALVAHQVNPDLHTVTRLFDHDLASRVETRLTLGPTRSVSMLAAPAFAAAALGRRPERVVSIGRRVLIFSELVIQPGSVAERGITAAAIAEMPGVRLLAHRSRGGDWSWEAPDERLSGGDAVAVVATRDGLAGLVRTIKRPHGQAWRRLLARPDDD